MNGRRTASRAYVVGGLVVCALGALVIVALASGFGR